MRLLHVIDRMDPAFGGTSQAIRNIVPPLIDLGIENEVACTDHPKASYLQKDSFKIHALGPSTGPWNYSSKLTPWLQDNLNRFDVVIIHGLWLHHGYATSKEVLRSRDSRDPKKGTPKLYVMPHGMLDPYFQTAPDRKMKAIRNWVYWKLIEATIINNVDGVFFTCETELLLAREPFRPYRPKKELNVGFGIQQPPSYTDAMRQAFLKKCPQLKNQRYLLFLSRIHEKKGVDLLIKSYSEIATDGSLKLVVAGPGLETSYGQTIQQLVSENNLKDFVFFPGMLSGDEKWGAFYECEAFILPSHQENFGIAVVEALACNKPVLISNKVNIWREIEGAGGGVVADNTQSGTTALLTRWYKLSPEAKALMGRNARRVFEEHFAIVPVAKRIIAALKD
jgi:glycosyltransferase involved in cell wall biosynthesis